jgi:hypothetical protein
MKFQQIILLVGLTAAISGVCPAVYNQFVRAQAAPNNTSVQQQNTTQNDKDVYLPLLARTFVNFLTSKNYRSDSQMEIGGQYGSANVKFNVNINTIVKAPKQFRSEISFPGNNGTPVRRYTVISNGKEVWTYRPDARQYAVSSYAEFDGSDNSFLIGLLPSLYLSLFPSVQESIASGSFDYKDVLAELEVDSAGVKWKKQNLEGKEYYVYGIDEAKSDYQFNFFVEPETATIKQIQLEGREKEFNIIVKDKIIRRVENPTIAANTFSFSPPRGTKRVKTISINPIEQ